MNIDVKTDIDAISQLVLDGKYEDAETRLIPLIQKLKQEGQYEAFILANVQLAKILYNSKRFEEMYPVIEETSPYLKQYATPKVQFFYRLLTILFYHAIGVSDPVLDLYSLLREAEKKNDVEQVLSVANNLLFILLERGDLDECIKLSKKLEHKFGLADFSNPTLSLGFYMNCCELYARIEQFDKVAQIYEIVEAKVDVEYVPFLEYSYLFYKALLQAHAGNMKQAYIYFNKSFQMMEDKYYFLMELELWVKSLQKHGYMEDVIYYQGVMIETLQNHVKVEQRAERAKFVEKLAKVSLTERMYRDSLTKVKNRAFYEDELAKDKHYTNYTMVIFDIDSFKTINDTYGHLVGDQAIQFIASVASRHLQKHGMEIIRYGGDEFILLLPYSKEEVYPIVETLHDTINEKQFIIRETGKIIQLNISIGGSHTGNDPVKLGQLFKEADKALYLAKEQGRNQICWYNVKDSAPVMLYT